MLQLFPFPGEYLLRRWEMQNSLALGLLHKPSVGYLLFDQPEGGVSDPGPQELRRSQHRPVVVRDPQNPRKASDD
jgi:hypothetical protein